VGKIIETEVSIAEGPNSMDIKVYRNKKGWKRPVVEGNKGQGKRTTVVAAVNLKKTGRQLDVAGPGGLVSTEPRLRACGINRLR